MTDTPPRRSWTRRADRDARADFRTPPRVAPAPPGRCSSPGSPEAARRCPRRCSPRARSFARRTPRGTHPTPKASAAAWMPGAPGGPGRGTERAEHVHQRVRPPPPPRADPDRAARPRRPRDVRNVGANLGRPFSAASPDGDDDRSLPRTRLRSDRHPRLATRSSAARRGGDGRRTRAVSTRRSSPRSFFLLPRGEARRRRTPFSTLFANFF